MSVSPLRTAPAQAAKLFELHLLADESAVFYLDAACAAGQDTTLGQLFARLASSKQHLAAVMARAMPANVAPDTEVRTPALSTLRKIRTELRARRDAAGETYVDKMPAVEQSQLKAVIDFLDRDLPMPMREKARPYLRAMHKHQDLIDHALARRRAS